MIELRGQRKNLFRGGRAQLESFRIIVVRRFLVGNRAGASIVIAT